MSTELGEKFVHAVARGAFDELASVFTDEVVFIAATPGCSWHVQGIARAGQALRELFPQSEKITAVVALEHHEVPGRFRISYRLRGDKDDYGPFEYEQQAYYSTVDGRIDRLRVLCSGIYPPPG